MLNKKFASILTIPLLITSLYTATPAKASTTPENLTNFQEIMKDQKAVDKAMEIVLQKTNEEIKSGKEDIEVSQYVPEINQNVSVEFKVKDVPTKIQSNNLQKSIVAYAVPSGRKDYSGKVNAWGFTHTLRGTFVYSGGKVTSASKEVLNSGITYSHSGSASITKLDPSVWSIHSKSVHKWLGQVGGVTGLGYTSYITVEVYGSGTSALKKATYTTGS
jgi:hypothetical protein